MGQYKVPQNVEAEDHILGPLTFKRFIYLIIGVAWIMLSFVLFRSTPLIAIAMAAPPALLFGLLAFYNRDGQDFEHLLVALVGFFALPRKRFWIKEDEYESFHINPTIHAAEASQRNAKQVRSELEKLATLIDSRGWNLPPSTDTGTHLTMPVTAQTDRIVIPPVPVPQPNEVPHTDILDMQNSPLAQNLAQLLQQAADDVRQQAVAQMAAPSAGQMVKPASNRLAAGPAKSISDVTRYSTGDILRLATQSDELSVAQVAAKATRMNASLQQREMEQ